MLKRIRLENFKSWRELDLELSNLNILFGTNSSGKTSILQALLLLKQTVISHDKSLSMNLGGSENDFIDLGSYKDIVFNHEENQHISLQLNWFPIFEGNLSPLYRDYNYIHKNAHDTSNEEGVSYKVEWQYSDERVHAEQVIYTVDFAGNPLEIHFIIKRDKEHTAAEVFPSTKHPNRDVYDISSFPNAALNESTPSYLLPEQPFTNKLLLESCYLTRPYYELLVDLDETSRIAITVTTYDLSSELELLINTIIYLGPLRGYPKRFYTWRGTLPHEIGVSGEKTIELLLASERDNSGLLGEVSAWLEKMNLVSEFQIRSVDESKRYYEPRVKITPDQVFVSIMDVGIGVSQVLPVITLLLSAEPGSIILLEQPELHLHPNAQAHLADLFLYVAEKRGLQLIVESHSEHLVRRLQRRIAETETTFATPETVRMYFCEPSENGSIAKPVEIDRYGQIKNWPKNFFGDIEGDLMAMTRAALDRRRQELAANE